MGSPLERAVRPGGEKAEKTAPILTRSQPLQPPPSGGSWLYISELGAGNVFLSPSILKLFLGKSLDRLVPEALQVSLVSPVVWEFCSRDLLFHTFFFLGYAFSFPSN